MAEKDYLLIFLDIDGVLNRCERLLTFTLDDYCLRNFSDFVHKAERKYAVRIYLASSWRRGLAKDLDPEGCSPQMKLLLRKFDEFHMKLSGFTPVSNRPACEVRRDDEIRRVIRQLDLPDHRVITIDDDAELYSDNREDINLYLTDYKKGFTEKDVQRALRRIAEGSCLAERSGNV